jgi:sugar phosphate permease
MTGAFSGLLGAAILRDMDGKGGLPAWRWLFIIEGVVCFPVAALTVKCVPDCPKTTKWLTAEERKLAVLRISEEANQEDNRPEVTSMQGAKLAF